MWLCHINEQQRRWVKNDHRRFGLSLKKRHTALFVAYLESPSFSLLALHPEGALSGTFLGATVLPK